MEQLGTPVDGTFVCRDIALSKEALADRMNDTSHASGRGSIIRRDAPILVAKDNGEQYMLEKVGSGQAREAKTFTSPRQDATPGAIKPSFEVRPEHGIGVMNTPRKVASTAPQITVKTVETVQPPPPTPIPVVTNPTVVAQPDVTQYAVAPVVKKAKKTITIKNPSLGKMRIRVDHLAISETLVIIGYDDVEDANIVEPPLCTPDYPLVVTYEDKSYNCMFGEWTAKMDNIFLVVLVRIPG
jgi:hypothetical protein